MLAPGLHSSKSASSDRADRIVAAFEAWLANEGMLPPGHQPVAAPAALGKGGARAKIHFVTGNSNKASEFQDVWDKVQRDLTDQGDDLV